MNKRNIFYISGIFMLFVCSMTAFSQELTTVHKIGLGLHGLDYAYEIPVARKITIEPFVGFGPSYNLHEEDFVMARLNWHWVILNPSVHLGVNGKYIYNRDRRVARGKSLLFNSGNFIGVKVKYISRPLTNKPNFYSNTLFSTVSWGGQHNLGRHWNFSYAAGVGYGYNIDFPYSMFFPALDLKVAYVLPV